MRHQSGREIGRRTSRLLLLTWPWLFFHRGHVPHSHKPRLRACVPVLIWVTVSRRVSACYSELFTATKKPFGVLAVSNDSSLWAVLSTQHHHIVKRGGRPFVHPTVGSPTSSTIALMAHLLVWDVLWSYHWNSLTLERHDCFGMDVLFKAWPASTFYLLLETMWLMLCDAWVSVGVSDLKPTWMILEVQQENKNIHDVHHIYTKIK